MVTTAAWFAEPFLTAAQVPASAFHAHEAASLGVSFGSSLLGATQRGSISPIRGRSPLDTAWMPSGPPPNAASIRQNLAPGDGSRHRKVGATISGGKTDPSS